MLQKLKIFSLLFINLWFISCTQEVIIAPKPINTEEEMIRNQLNQFLEKKDIDGFINTVLDYPYINNLNGYYDSKGNTIMHLISEKGDTQALQFLISNDYTLPLDRPNHYYSTPSNIAIENQQCNVLEILLIKGVDPLLVSKNQPSYLVQSLLKRNYDCMETLLIHEPKVANQIVKNDWQPLHYIAYTGDIKALDLLVKYNPDFLATAPIDMGVPFYTEDRTLGLGNLNPFQIALLKANMKTAEKLLQIFPDYPNRTTTIGMYNTEIAQLSNSPAMIAWAETTDPNYKEIKKERIAASIKGQGEQNCNCEEDIPNGENNKTEVNALPNTNSPSSEPSIQL